MLSINAANSYHYVLRVIMLVLWPLELLLTSITSGHDALYAANGHIIENSALVAVILKMIFDIFYHARTELTVAYSNCMSLYFLLLSREQWTKW